MSGDLEMLPRHIYTRIYGRAYARPWFSCLGIWEPRNQHMQTDTDKYNQTWRYLDKHLLTQIGTNRPHDGLPKGFREILQRILKLARFVYLRITHNTTIMTAIKAPQGRPKVAKTLQIHPGRRLEGSLKQQISGNVVGGRIFRLGPPIGPPYGCLKQRFWSLFGSWKSYKNNKWGAHIWVIMF